MPLSSAPSAKTPRVEIGFEEGAIMLFAVTSPTTYSVWCRLAAVIYRSVARILLVVGY